MTLDSNEFVSIARPKSSRAQIVTAWIAASLAVLLALFAAVTWFILSAFGNSLDNAFDDFEESSAPSAVTQWLCLPYTQFVLEQHRAGLTPEQIMAVLEVSEYKRGGQLGVTPSVAEINEPRLDSPEACGLPFEIINAADNAGPTP
ncbi:hypothetical protein [Rhodococcus sp. NCIMB 12038]|uniref:hypothetical protein n=1 Tax=Rhodococcus sp. NCIMB 12038 TaxID=933800 RepID=UPI000B3C938D|nr:hypothetical protein [Rhodococcus sp. NCIMB 12038]OUS97359.1 hypothetical protein CA951_03165 [Rhodococcus sp. NCIMB 12038]